MKNMFQAISSLVNRRKETAEPKISEISINECAHYGGFLYGGRQYNPYESYIIKLSQNKKQEAREEFICFLQYYRPTNMAEALGIKLNKEISLWTYPWTSYIYETGEEPVHKTGWYSEPNNVPDILTHFSSKGILKFRIEEEFVWLEKAFYSIKQKGYQPALFNNYIEVIQFIASDGKKSYLALDGNHRLSALHALGRDKVEVIIKSSVKETEIGLWPQVASGFINQEDARAIFYAYFLGNQNIMHTMQAANILEY